MRMYIRLCKNFRAVWIRTFLLELACQKVCTGVMTRFWGTYFIYLFVSFRLTTSNLTNAQIYPTTLYVKMV